MAPTWQKGALKQAQHIHCIHWHTVQESAEKYQKAPTHIVLTVRNKKNNNGAPDRPAESCNTYSVTRTSLLQQAVISGRLLQDAVEVKASGQSYTSCVLNAAAAAAGAALWVKICVLSLRGGALSMWLDGKWEINFLGRRPRAEWVLKTQQFQCYIRFSHTPPQFRGNNFTGYFRLILQYTIHYN